MSAPGPSGGGRPRIVVTGLGAVSPLGLSARASYEAARDGVCAIVPQVLDPGPNGPDTHTTPAALVSGDLLAATEAAVGRRIAASLDPFALMALASAQEALDAAGLLGHPCLEQRAALVLGHGFAGIHTL